MKVPNSNQKTALATQLAEEAYSYLAFSSAVDESTDNSNTAQLSNFIIEAQSQISVTDKLIVYFSERDTLSTSDTHADNLLFFVEIVVPTHSS